MREVSACDFCGASDAGTFEVLPPRVDGGRRMVLCDDCRETLGGVVEPLLEYVAGDGDVGLDAGSASEPTERVEDPATGEDDRADADARRDAGRPDDGATTGEASADADGTRTASEEEEAEGTSDAGDDGGTKMAATGAGTSSGVPRGYRKTVRFLENREFPMEREQAVSMTSDAYGLDEEAVHAAIDHAIKHDRLKEFDGELRQP